jgi:hypothetical protein
MKNKELAFDYINKALFQDINIGAEIMSTNKLNAEDKEEINVILDVLSKLNQVSLNYQASQQELVKKTEGFTLRHMENTFETIISLKYSLKDVIKDAKSAYKKVMWMYVVAFYLGVGLIITSIVFAAYGKAILSVAFGAIGLIDLVTHFIFKPPLELQTSRSNLAQLMVALTNWFADLMNLNSYLSLKSTGITLADLEAVSDKQNKNTEHILKLIEDYCEPSAGKKTN